MGYSIFSFFSGSGFLDLGFEMSGFRIDLVNEYSRAFIYAYRYSRQQMGLTKPKYGYQNIDVNEYLSVRADELREYIKAERVDGNLVGFIGGPPCPDFSVAGKQRGREGDIGRLSLSYIHLIIDQHPDFFYCYVDTSVSSMLALRRAIRLNNFCCYVDLNRLTKSYSWL